MAIRRRLSASRAGVAPGSLRKQVGHLEGGHGRLVTLVAVSLGTPGQGLVDGVGGEHPEDDRDAGVERGALEARRAFAGDEIEMRGLAPDDRAQRHHGIDRSRLGQSHRRQRQLEGTGHPGHGDRGRA